MVIVALPTTAFFLLQNNKIQTYLTQIIAKEASENLNAKFEVESVKFRFFNRVILKNVYIEDQQRDTLLFSKEIICNLKTLDRKQKKIDIQNINLIGAKIYLTKFDSLQPINIGFLTNRSSNKDSVKNSEPNWEIIFHNIEMHESVFWYKSYRKKNQDNNVVDFNDLVCQIKELEIKDLKIENGVVDFYTKKLVFKEKSGFDVFNVKFIKHKNNILQMPKIKSIKRLRTKM